MKDAGTVKFQQVIILLMDLLTILLCLNFHYFTLNESVKQIPYEEYDLISFESLDGLQQDTGLRQVRVRSSVNRLWS